MFRRARWRRGRRSPCASSCTSSRGGRWPRPPARPTPALVVASCWRSSCCSSCRSSPRSLRCSRSSPTPTTRSGRAGRSRWRGCASFRCRASSSRLSSASKTRAWSRRRLTRVPTSRRQPLPRRTLRSPAPTAACATSSSAAACRAVEARSTSVGRRSTHPPRVATTTAGARAQAAPAAATPTATASSSSTVLCHRATRRLHPSFATTTTDSTRASVADGGKD
mmetsp:Transcript_22400/g.78488  ORF Transcript_22400/g.78488 Transcript_22400/m.78488 type:complete len:223 (-) Transcript_22400:218-886(-)